VAEIAAQCLADPPTYELPAEEPDYLAQTRAWTPQGLPVPDDLSAVLLALLASPNIASKEWVYHQYDHMVQTNTVIAPGAGDAAVLRVKGRREGLAIKTDGNGRYCYLDPYVGAQIAVAEAARNVVCVGADPAGVTDCLNFGNPEKPDRFWQFKEAVRGVADACRALGVAVVSGNVSFYNENPESAIYPTPVIGLVGVLDDIDHRCAMGFDADGDHIVLLGDTAEELGGTEYLAREHGLETGRPPALDLEREKRVQSLCLEAIRSGWVSSAHDCSDGGLAVALAECCIIGGRGAEVILPESEKGIRPDARLFGETQSRILLSVPPEREAELRRLAKTRGVPAHAIGRVGGAALRIAAEGRELVRRPVTEMSSTWRTAIANRMAS
jgi:phosphoribosylformylglycinamidine synthase